MVDIAPFRALRYTHPKNKNDISRSICPPYDVISPLERESLVGKSAENVVQLELPAGEGVAKYENARHLLHQWKDSGVLHSDQAPYFYLLETTYRIKDAFAPASRIKRTGVLAALRLETPGKGAVHPHEKTLPKAKDDRLNLITAVRTNVSPIFGLFFDTKSQWTTWVSKTVRKKPSVTGREKKDLDHRMWIVDDPALQNSFRRLLKSKDLYIADGHHRYEVSWAYKEKRLGEEPASGRAAGWNYVMAYICPMEEPGLLMLPTHRLVKSNRSFVEWRKHLSSFFDQTPVKSIKKIVETLKAVPSAGKKRKRLIGWATQEGCFLLSVKKEIPMDLCLQNRPPALRELDVVLLHDLALGEAFQSPFLAENEKEIIYTRDLVEMESRIQADARWMGFLVGSSGVGSLARVAGADQVMPPKTTYFYPKVPTGFTLMPLEQTIE